MSKTEDGKEKDKYFTIAGVNRSQIKIKGSSFIATVVPAKDRAEAEEILQKLRSEFYDATHNCFAYRFGPDGLDFRYSDDGEPSGTAGRPILFALNKFSLTDIICVVTRYFGGTKLGVGPLARAYSQSAIEALEGAAVKTLWRTTDVQVFCIYEDVTLIKRLLAEYATSYDETYSDACEFNAKVPISNVAVFCEKITSMTNARAGALVRNA